MKKIMIMDQGNSVAYQILGKAIELFGRETEYLMLKLHEEQNQAIEIMEKAVSDEKPEILLIGATAFGEEVTPALGVRFRTGVAAHCIDIKKQNGKPVFLVPAFGGRVIGEILIPGAEPGRPAIATVKPGTFDDFSDPEGICRIIDTDSLIGEGKMPAGTNRLGGFRLTDIQPRKQSKSDISKAQLIFCGGYGLGSGENWNKIEMLAEKYGGGAACTRPVVDMQWGPDESSMIGTSGKTVKPKVYIGFGISGASHHVCGIKDAEVIININNDKNAEVFMTSDYKGVFDAEAVIDALLGEE